MDFKKMEDGFRMILEGMGEDPNREGLIDTPKRVAKMYAELMTSLTGEMKAEDILKTRFHEKYDEMIIVPDIQFASMCEHHFLPFTGKAHVAYIPGDCVVGLSKIPRVVEYYGGPVPVPGKPVEDADVQVLARYVGRTINTARPEPVEPMDGRWAFLGGRVGKGRVFISCPHPELTECTHDIVRSGIKYLTGVAPSPVYNDRTRGAVTVLYGTSKDDESLKFYYNDFLRDRRFYVRTGFDANDYAHADAIVTAMSDASWLNAPSVRRFAKRGGRIVLVARSDKERAAAAKIAGAVVVGSCAEIPAAILN